AHAYAYPRVSPDGRQVAVEIAEASSDIWVYDLMRNTLNRLTFQGLSTNPIWTPDGKRIVYRSTKTGVPGINLFWKSADGAGIEEQLTTGDLAPPSSISPDGKILGYTGQNPKTGFDVMTLALEGDRKPQPFLATPADERGPYFSPDGHWAAYV